VLLAAAAGAATWFGMPVKYTATTLLHVSLKEPKVLGNDSQSMMEFSTYQKAQGALVTSRLVLNSVLKRGAVGRLDGLPSQPDEQIDWLQREIKVDFKTGPEFMRISITGDRAEELKTLLNTVADVYLKEVVYKERTQKLARLNRLKEIQSKYEETLRNRRESVRNLILAVGSGDAQVIAVKQRYAEEALGATEKERLQIQSELRRVELDLKTKEARALGEKGAALPALTDAELERLVDSTPAVAQLQAQKERLERELAANEHLAVRGRDEPALKPYYSELAQIEADLKAARAKLLPRAREEARARARAEAQALVAGLRERCNYLRELDRSLGETTERLRKQTRTTSVGQADIDAFKLEIAQTEKMAERVGAEVESLKLEVDAPRRVELLEEASASQSSMERQRYKATGAAALAGLFLAVGGVSWREFCRRRLDSVTELSQDLGMAVVGTLPSPPSAGRSLLPWRRAEAEEWEEVLTDHVDAARTSLLHRARVKGVRVVLVTSALCGEGKTSLSCQLAGSLARAGYRTLLIDGDLRRPAAHGVFGLPGGPGLSELLRKEIEVSAAVRRTGTGRLWLLPAGKWDPRATQALARGRLPNLLKDLREQYEYIVIDSAPVLPVVDSLLLAQHVNGVILSVLREVSQMPLVQAALERLGGVGVPILGAIMNGAPSDVTSYRYRYRGDCDPTFDQAEPEFTEEPAPEAAADRNMVD
jgi:capsular exopolysaccharide synthesis family protein